MIKKRNVEGERHYGADILLPFPLPLAGHRKVRGRCVGERKIQFVFDGLADVFLRTLRRFRRDLPTCGLGIIIDYLSDRTTDSDFSIGYMLR